MPAVEDPSPGPAAPTLLDRLRGCRVGVVLFSHRALPAGVPVCYAVDGDDIVFRVAEGTPVARATDDSVVALYVQELDADGECGWHVTAAGVARHVTGQDAGRATRIAVPAWRGAAASVFVRLVPDVVTGEVVGS